MNMTTIMSRKELWDRMFFRLVIPAITVAAAIGLFFGNPVDNLVVISWIVPLWILVRTLSPAKNGYNNTSTVAASR
jgi:hypothetical protein